MESLLNKLHGSPRRAVETGNGANGDQCPAKVQLASTRSPLLSLSEYQTSELICAEQMLEAVRGEILTRERSHPSSHADTDRWVAIGAYAQPSDGSQLRSLSQTIRLDSSMTSVPSWRESGGCRGS